MCKAVAVACCWKEWCANWIETPSLVNLQLCGTLYIDLLPYNFNLFGYLKSLGRNMLFSLHSNLGFMEMFCHFAIWTVTAPHGLSFFDMCRIITLYDHDKYPTLILVFPSKNTKKTKQKFTKKVTDTILLFISNN